MMAEESPRAASTAGGVVTTFRRRRDMTKLAEKDDDDRGWNLHWREREKQHELCYRVGPGDWRKHRVPRSVAGELALEKYARVYVETKRRQGFPAATQPKAAPGRPGGTAPAAVTFGDFATEWTDGTLSGRFRDHVKLKKSSDDDAAKVKLLAPVIGHVPLSAFTLDDAERAMRQLDDLRAGREREAARVAGRDPRALKPLSRSSRRQYAQVIHRVLGLAVYPARVIASNPLPKGFLPKPGGAKPLAYLYPDEDATLLAHTATPLALRLLFGFLDREGMREGEALALRRRDLDLVRGAITLDANKTDDPRAWAMHPGTTRALVAWLAIRDTIDKAKEETGKDAPKETPAERGAKLVFTDDDGRSLRADSLAGLFRDALQAAGVTRVELFEAKAGRMKIRVHDLRATFVTLSLANGKTEAWVASRTGHRSSAMINRYRRAAQKVEELALRDLAPLDEAIPELRSAKPDVAPPSPPGPAASLAASPATPPPATRQLVADLVAAALSRAARRGASVGNYRVGRAGLEPATYGLKVHD